MPSWKKVLVSGSDASLNSLNVATNVVAQSFTGSLFGTASFAVSASQAQNATTASYVLNAISASFSTSASFVTASNVFGPFGSNSVISASFAVSASFAQTASFVQNAVSASFASTASSADNFTVRNTITAQTLIVQTITSSIVYSSGSNIFGNDLSNTQILTGSVSVTGSLAVNNSNVIVSSQTSSMSVATASFAQTASYVTLAQTASYVENAQTASFVLNAVTASFVTGSNVYGPFGSNSVISSSFALTASFALNGGGSTNTGSLLTTGSVAGNVLTFTKGDATTFNLTVATGSGGGGGGATVVHTQLTASTTWSFGHNLNTLTPLLQVYDLGYEQIIPNEIASIDAFTSEIRFTYSQSGYAVASSGGGLNITGSTPRLTQTIAATTWSFAHNLGTKYPVFEIFNSNDDVVIPAGIHSVDTNNAEIYFALPSTGVAIANFSGIDGIFPSSSYAFTASYSDEFHIGQTQTQYATVTSSINGSNIVFTQATGSYSSAFFKYTVASASNARSGEIMSVWNGSTVTFTDNSTTDIGTTTAVTSSVAISASNAQLTMQTNTAGWRIKSIATFM